MAPLAQYLRQHPRASSALLWIASILITLLCVSWQDTTGPTYPLEGELATARGPVHYKFLRSETIGTPLRVMMLDPVPAGVTASVRYRRYRSHDDWTTMPMEHGSFVFTRRGISDSVTGIGARLPSLTERAGKYEYVVLVDDGSGAPISVTGDQPVYARYKAHVPMWALAIHILTIFVSMTIAVRATFAAVVNEEFRRLVVWAVASLVLGGFIFGPLVQWYAFGVWWSGFPFGYDWTDNKVVVELVFWLFALWMNRGGRHNRWSVVLAGVATLIVYFIPHSVFGSEFDYTTGRGHGTAG